MMLYVGCEYSVGELQSQSNNWARFKKKKKKKAQEGSVKFAVCTLWNLNKST